MMEEQTHTVQIIPVESINVLNPRVRSKKSFRELVDSIETVGLKRPITVTQSHRPGERTDFDLVCGQGRLEAFKVLGETMIPAFVIVADLKEALIKSLVENCARRQHSANDLLRDIARLKEFQYSDTEIARKTGLSAEYVRGVARLMAQGEQRLLRAVESGQVPLSVAVDIATADDAAIQDALQQAYESNELRGRKLLIVRKLMENRRRRGKGLGGSVARRKENVTSASLIRVYQEDTERKRLLIRKADATRNRLLFITHAMRQLLKDDVFHEILSTEELSTIPRNLATRISKGEVA
jgi:ParB family transcriptional regulator, chromosome partitioning protein